MHNGLKLHDTDAFFPMSAGASKRASKQVSAAERASEASSAH